MLKSVAVFGSVAIATGVRLLLAGGLGLRSAFLTYFLAVVYSSWVAGWSGGVGSIALTLGGVYLLIHTIPTSSGANLPSVLDYCLFILEGLAITALGQGQLSARRLSQTTAAQAQEYASESKRNASALASSEVRLRFAIDGSRIGTWHWEIARDLLTWSETMQELVGRPGSQPSEIKSFLEAIHPDDREMFGETVYGSFEAGKSFGIETRVVWIDGSVHWLLIRGLAQQEGKDSAITIEGVGIDITERKLAEQEADALAQRQIALNEVSRAIRQTRNAQQVHDIALKALAETLQVDRCASILIDLNRKKLSYVADWHGPDLPDFIGEYNLSDLDIDLQKVFAGATSLVIPDIENSQLSAKAVSVLQQGQISATISVPLMREGEVFATLAVYMANGARDWTSEDVSFVEAVAGQLHSEMETIRLLSEAQQRAEREALINHIGDVIRSSASPEHIQHIAVTILGEALGVDRCYFAIYDLDQDTITIGRDWHRADLPSIHGIHPFSNTSRMFEELYHGEPTSIVFDRDDAGLSAETIENMKSLQIRARVSVAVSNARGMATLTAVMSDTARVWTADEVDLIEKVTTQLRSAVEMARVQLREHRIAHDLQVALLPKLPDQVPGLRLASQMQPALEEAEIGGDFCDVFLIDNNRYAIVIGDVSGKGLAAAGQLATVRNSLRTTLYLYENPAEVLTRLSTILTSHELLIGFVTAFVGIYDATSGVIRYSSGGHEPGLVLKCDDGDVVTLDSTGPPLGISDVAEYEQGEVQLLEGDMLLLYTDGLSEAGPDRSNLLQTAGLIQLFKSLCTADDLEFMARNMVVEVTRFANGILRDDVCVLLAKRVANRSEAKELTAVELSPS